MLFEKSVQKMKEAMVFWIQWNEASNRCMDE